MIREKDIKAALIDWLYEKGHVEDAVIINEMVVANWSRRADIAVANGRLYAYEIKSDADTLKRLPGQVDLFSSHFDKVTLVVASKFVSTVLDGYPPEIGVLEVVCENGAVRLRQARAGRIVETKDAAVLSSFLTKLDLYKLLRKEGVKATPDMPRRDLVGQVSTLPTRVVKSYVLSFLKEKYKATFDAFSFARLSLGSYESISMLSRRDSAVRSGSEVQKSYSETVFCSNPNARPLSLGGLDLPLEHLQDLPATVICRRPRS